MFIKKNGARIFSLFCWESDAPKREILRGLRDWAKSERERERERERSYSLSKQGKERLIGKKKKRNGKKLSLFEWR